MRLILLISVVMLCTACTSRAWYEGVQSGKESECRRQPEAEVQRCLDRVNKQSYDDYEKTRSK